MYKHQNKLRLTFYAIFSLIALIILVDFVAPGRFIIDEIVAVQKERQQYYNAARNYHYSYKVATSEHEFLVDEDFAELELMDKRIEYSVSPLFKQVNWYKLSSDKYKSFYSLRIASGLVLPMLTIITIFVAFKYKKKLGIFLFILQILIIVDLLFLMT